MSGSSYFPAAGVTARASRRNSSPSAAGASNSYDSVCNPTALYRSDDGPPPLRASTPSTQSRAEPAPTRFPPARRNSTSSIPRWRALIRFEYIFVSGWPGERAGFPLRAPDALASGDTNVKSGTGRRRGDYAAGGLSTIRQRARPPRTGSAAGGRPGALGVRPAGVTRQRGLQEGHLIGEDAAIAEDESFAAAYRVRNIQQRHVRFFRTATALARIARAARGHDVG